jgi:hypothetical protein
MLARSRTASDVLGARRPKRWQGFWPALWPTFWVCIASCRSAGDPPKQDPAKQDPGPIHGSLATRYQGRWKGNEHDHDLTEVVSLELGDKKKDPVTGFVMAEGLADLDGSGSGGSGTFHSLADTYDGAVTGRLYHAYADLHLAPSFETLRLGRQMIVDTPEVAYFDGLRAETVDLGEPRIRLGAFGGVPVKIFGPSASGDSMIGLFAQSRPWTGGRVRADWMHVEDEGSFGPRRNDLLGIGASQSIGTNFSLDAEHTRLEEQPRDLRFRASWYAEDSDLVVQATWYRLLEAQGDLTVPFDPYYATLFDLFPYTQVGLLASKSLGPHFDLQTGVDFRRVAEAADVGEFNRDFNRFFATTGIRGVLPASLDLSLTGEVWDSQESEIRTFGADLSRRIGETIDASLGTDYSLFKYDLYQNRELDDVRTWYLQVAWKRSAATTFDLRYEVEDDSTDTYTSLRLGAIWRF